RHLRRRESLFVLRPLRSRCEEYVVERRLKSARMRFADTKTRTDFRLRRAINFHVDLADFVEQRADRSAREIGRIAIATEMSEHDAFDFSGKQFLDHLRC